MRNGKLGERCQRLGGCAILRPAQRVGNRHYRALDVLGRHKEQLCAHLIDRYREWFGVHMEFLLYDVTEHVFRGAGTEEPQGANGIFAGQSSGLQAGVHPGWGALRRAGHFPMKCSTAIGRTCPPWKTS